jgi:hypothetical protein
MEGLQHKKPAFTRNYNPLSTSSSTYLISQKHLKVLYKFLVDECLLCDEVQVFTDTIK